MSRESTPRRSKSFGSSIRGTDSWVEHFEWSGATLVGLTAIGRTTIEVLEINLPHRIALRKALIAEQRFTID